MKKMLFVYNPNAGKGLLKPKVSDIVDIFVKAGYEVVIYPTQSYRDAYKKVCELEKGYQLVVCSLSLIHIYQIRVNAVAPGVTKTDMVAALPDEVIQPLIRTIPLRRVGEPEDVANAFLFLASDMASYVTGEILSVDGAAMS